MWFELFTSFKIKMIQKYEGVLIFEIFANIEKSHNFPFPEKVHTKKKACWWKKTDEKKLKSVKFSLAVPQKKLSFAFSTSRE